MLIYFTLIELESIVGGCTENKPNPYSGIDGILSECLTYIANNVAGYDAVTVADTVSTYIKDVYSAETNGHYPDTLMNIITQKALGDVQDFDVFIHSLSLSPAALSYIYQIKNFTENIYQYLGSVPCATKPAVFFNASNTKMYNYVLGKAQCMMNKLMNDKSMTFEEKTLPLIGMQALLSALKYWSVVYQQTSFPSPSPWANFINSILGALHDPLTPGSYAAFVAWIDWTKGITLNEVLGAITGAVGAGEDHPTFDNVMVGAAAGGAYCSAMNMYTQLAKLALGLDV